MIEFTALEVGDFEVTSNSVIYYILKNRAKRCSFEATSLRDKLHLISIELAFERNYKRIEVSLVPSSTTVLNLNRHRAHVTT